MPIDPPQRNLMVAGRMLLSVHFLTELYDKLTRFAYWVEVCEASGQPYPVAEMMLVTLLLLFGAPLLLVRGEHRRELCPVHGRISRTYARTLHRTTRHARARVYSARRTTDRVGEPMTLPGTCMHPTQVGKHVPQAVTALIIFQVPTTIFFESTL
jgi:hypothetical protein